MYGMMICLGSIFYMALISVLFLFFSIVVLRLIIHILQVCNLEVMRQYADSDLIGEVIIVCWKEG